MDISQAYKQHQEIKQLYDEKAEIEKEIQLTNLAYKLAFVGTFTVYFIFVWMMYVSDLWGFTSWLVQNLSEFAALFIYGVLAVALPLAMALIKEIGYKHFAKYPNPLINVVSIVGILAFAGVIYESVSSSSQQQHISRTAAENSKTFESLSNTSINVMGGSVTADEIATASQKLARCEEKLKQGKEKHCEGDKAKLAALQQAHKDYADNQLDAAVQALETKTQTIAQLKEDSYKPIFKAARDVLGVSIDTGVMLVTLFVSIIFEISHLLLILFLGQKLKRLDTVKQSIIQTEAAYLSITGKTFKSEDFKDSSILDMDDIRSDGEESKPFDFGMVPNRASTNHTGTFYGLHGKVHYHSYPRFKWHDQQQPTQSQGLGFIGFTSPDQRTASPTVKRSDKVGAPAQNNRTLPANEVTQPKPDALSLDAELLSAMQEAQKQIPNDVLREAGTIYPAWRKQVKTREIRPSKRDGFKFISSKLCRGRNRTLTPASMVTLLGIWQLRAVSDGLLLLNPNQRQGTAKFLLR